MYLVRTLSTVGHMNFGDGGGGGGLSLEENGRKENEYVVLRVTQNTRCSCNPCVVAKIIENSLGNMVMVEVATPAS